MSEKINQSMMSGTPKPTMTPRVMLSEYQRVTTSDHSRMTTPDTTMIDITAIVDLAAWVNLSLMVIAFSYINPLLLYIFVALHSQALVVSHIPIANGPASIGGA